MTPLEKLKAMHFGSLYDEDPAEGDIALQELRPELLALWEAALNQYDDRVGDLNGDVIQALRDLDAKAREVLG